MDKRRLLILSLIMVPLAASAASAAPDARFDGGHPGVVPASAQAAAPAVRGREASPELERYWIKAEAPDALSRTKLLDAGMSIDRISGGTAEGIGTGRALERLKARGIRASAEPLSYLVHAQDFPARDKAYVNYDRLSSDLKALAAQAPDLASLFSIGQGWGEGGVAHQIWCLRLNTTARGNEKSSKPGVMLFGQHHAREHLSSQIPLMIARYLVRNRDNPEIKSLLQTRDIYIIPMTNPDGAEWDIRDGQYHMFRKNTRDDGQPADEIGVDLNRNYGYHWGTDGASSDPSDETYRGPAPFSEPETRAVKAFIEDHLNNVRIIITWHTFSELILYPWGYTDSPIGDAKARAAFQGMARAMANLTGYTPEQSSSLYTTSGDLTDWAWGAHKIFAFTIEMNPGDDADAWDGFYPGPSAIQTAFEANWPAALYAIHAAANPYAASQAAPALAGASELSASPAR